MSPFHDPRFRPESLENPNGITVAAALDFLQQQKPTALLVIRKREAGYDPVTEMEAGPAYHDPNATSWTGAYTSLDEDETPDPDDPTVIFLD